ncbi:hypothetical protein T440DRAFT_184450 [Plenodomus tracheiphilus IPT5]|uniref:Uncharacterized protein n=1 Tax=Plenodomus tracheiphilus IPT5 TaxID=1408161 RepID=A0A6A7B0F7_9PLEO|nr:hypothetical protein T440DRAFT_184450 [Plenodomus tracheiphilus IPT5]
MEACSERPCCRFRALKLCGSAASYWLSALLMIYVRHHGDLCTQYIKSTNLHYITQHFVNNRGAKPVEHAHAHAHACILQSEACNKSR